MKKLIMNSMLVLLVFFTQTQGARSMIENEPKSACTFGNKYNDNLQGACEQACKNQGMQKTGNWECAEYRGTPYKNCPAGGEWPYNYSCGCACCPLDTIICGSRKDKCCSCASTETACGEKCCPFNAVCKDSKCHTADDPALMAACQECNAQKVKGQDFESCLKGKGFNATIWGFNKFLDGRPDVCPHIQ